MMAIQKAFFLRTPWAARSGIYKISIDRGNLPRRFYIGQAVHIAKRWSAHLYLLRAKKHWNDQLQQDFDQYGENSCKFEIALICDRNSDILAMYEQALVDFFGSTNLYNLWIRCVKTGAGTPASPERKAKIAAAIRGLRRSKETKERIGRVQAWKRTPEGRAKMSVALKAAAKNRPPMSDEERAHRSATTHFRNLPPEAHKRGAATRNLNKLVVKKNSAWMLGYGS
jgi:group I intron endonuclease